MVDKKKILGSETEQGKRSIRNLGTTGFANFSLKSEGGQESVLSWFYNTFVKRKADLFNNYWEKDREERLESLDLFIEFTEDTLFKLLPQGEEANQVANLRQTGYVPYSKKDGFEHKNGKLFYDAIKTGSLLGFVKGAIMLMMDFHNGEKNISALCDSKEQDARERVIRGYKTLVFIADEAHKRKEEGDDEIKRFGGHIDEVRPVYEVVKRLEARARRN